MPNHLHLLLRIKDKGPDYGLDAGPAATEDGPSGATLVVARGFAWTLLGGRDLKRPWEWAERGRCLPVRTEI